MTQVMFYFFYYECRFTDQLKIELDLSEKELVDVSLSSRPKLETFFQPVQMTVLLKVRTNSVSELETFE
jgi:hypothetical protein